MAITSEVVNNTYLTVFVVRRRRFDPKFCASRAVLISCVVMFLFPLVRHGVSVSIPPFGFLIGMRFRTGKSDRNIYRTDSGSGFKN